MLFSSRPVNTIFSLSIMRSFLEGWSHFFFLVMEITPQKESIASTRTSDFFSSKTDFRLLPSRPPGMIRVTAGYRPVVARRHSLGEVRYQLAMLRRKRNRHSSPSVRPTTLAPPVHQLALKFLKMPYILSDLGPIIVPSHRLCPVVCSSLNDLTWCLIARWCPSHNCCDTSPSHFVNIVEEIQQARASITTFKLPQGGWPQLVPWGAKQLCLVTLCHYTQLWH